MQFPVFIKLHRSLFLLLFLFGIHGLAALGVLLLAWSWEFRLACLLFLVVSGLLAWRQVRGMPDSLHLHQDGSLALERGGKVFPAALLPGWLALPGLCVLRCRDAAQGRTETLVLLPDASDKESLRRLRIWLRLCAPAAPGA